ncbi:HTH-type transcriptional repressor CarH [Paenibacillus sp. JJ-100]|uniref:MerR family transcriptional regulator n=1 Tax=Paenibacillus sp. JJ-100 TaxID=2974896 RepID=UPI0022FF7E8D|nr:MerR family transcriptional regulator [Paenibacillus sp. JJ-100]CAI6081041.1 HTH-type transcriptional repressor CarH [Paenibacillus sp. JJ-100]
MYSIKQVATMLGIQAVTLRAWENRYNAVTPERTESGYRMYTEENVADLRWLKEQIDDHQTNISEAVRMLKIRKENVHDTASPVPMAPTVPVVEEAYTQMADQIYDSLYHFQGERANGLIDFGFTMYGYDSMFYHVLVPILVRVGDAWEEGRATVAQEHFMTQLISQRFYQFFHLFPIYPHLPKVLALCPEGEHHQVGLLLFSLFMRKNGAEVLYLGANTPEEGVFPILREQKIKLVCLSVTNSGLVNTCDQLISKIRDEFPHIRFVLGGKGFERAKNARYPEWIMPEDSSDWQSWFEREYFTDHRSSGTRQ